MFKWLGGLVDSNEKELKRLQSLVDTINRLEPEFKKLSDDELGAKTAEFKARLAKGSSLDELLPEAFAAVREAAKRTIGLRHFDVQLIGGIVLHQGKIAEMKTGEGKTLVATLPLYLNALTGKGVHLVTVNDYLARRDPYWMGPVYHALGLSVASIYPMQSPDEHTPALLYDPEFDSGDSHWPHFRPVPRKEAYKADITYGTSAEFGFDYLRDNMVTELSQCVQRPVNYAIADEVDYLLIDEARTPLIISGPAEDYGQLYKDINTVVSRLKFKVLPYEEKTEMATLEEQYDYIAFEKEHTVRATTRAQEKLARARGMKVDYLFGGHEEETRQLTDEQIKERNDILAIFRHSMSAHALYKRDREYVVGPVEDGRPGIIIVDDFTGRLMHGRRYSEGLHQAIEAKEHLSIRRESRTYATVTIQNYFRMYEKLAGMTGTALTEAEEFHKIYKLEVVVIPTHKPMVRQEFPDQIYKDVKSKFKAVVREIEQLHKEGRPVLVGTVSIENSEYLSDLLTRKGIPHHILNAKQHEKEAYIVAQAGKPGAVTVATNMAGRGVDIILGGNPQDGEQKGWQKEHEKVVGLGGLHIIGTDRHEARRIDNQLRGRAGRQGDPGSSRFYVSLEDEIVRRFGGDRIKGLMEWAGMDEDTPVENALVNKSIEGAQVRVEGYNFDIRKHLVEYDDVINRHRELIYGERKKIIGDTDLKSNILSLVGDEIKNIVAAHTTNDYGEGWDTDGLIGEVAKIFPLPPTFKAEAISRMKPKQIEEKLIELAGILYEEKEKEIGPENMRAVERLVMLRIIDTLWVEHLTMMEHMRQGIGLQAAGQRDPLVAYKREGHGLFQNLLSTIQHDVVHSIYRVSITRREAPPKPPAPVQAGGDGQKQKLKAGGKKIGRNDPCPCGSGKKYKHCCGR